MQRIRCPKCGNKFDIPAFVPGVQGRCPECRTVFKVPAGAVPPSEWVTVDEKPSRLPALLGFAAAAAVLLILGGLVSRALFSRAATDPAPPESAPVSVRPATSEPPAPPPIPRFEPEPDRPGPSPSGRPKAPESEPPPPPPDDGIPEFRPSEPSRKTAPPPVRRPASTPRSARDVYSLRNAFDVAMSGADWKAAQDALSGIEVLLPTLDIARRAGFQRWLRLSKGSLSVRKTLFEALPAAKERVREAHETVVREAREASEREKRLTATLAKQTLASPLRLTLPGGYTIEKVRVTDFKNGEVNLVWPQGEVRYPLELLPPDARRQLLRGAAREGPARDLFEIGKLHIHSRDFDSAARVFDKAIGIDPKLVPLRPDLDRLKRLSRVFEGSYKATGNRLSVRWTFRKTDEARDFTPVAGQCRVDPRTGLAIGGAKVSYAVVKDIPFRDRVKVTATPVASKDTAHFLGVRFVRPDGVEVMIFAQMATGVKAFSVQKIVAGKSTSLREPTRYSRGNEMVMDFSRGIFRFKIGNNTLWSGSEGGFTEVSVILGGGVIGSKTTPAGAITRFRNLSVLGEVNPAWMRKTMAGYREALAAELARERRIKVGKEGSTSLALSVDGLLSIVDSRTRASYEKALGLLAEYTRTRKIADFNTAFTAMGAVTVLDREFALPWYHLGNLAQESGSDRAAARYYERALNRFPEFPEALAARAELHMLAEEWEIGKDLLDRALALRPDLPLAQLLLARMRYREGDSAQALEVAGVAKMLAPLDEETRGKAQMIRNIVHGPLWNRTNEHRTEHYIVRSDLSSKKCAEYAAHLETMRGVYASALGLPALAKKQAQVLIFNAEEGYHSYMSFTAGSRLENTLGVFSTWYGQLALYEDAEREETLGVLYHEGFHQYLKSVLPQGAPIWFNEGMAEYVGATTLQDGKLVKTGGIQEGRLRNLKAAIRYGWKPLPFKRIMAETHVEFMSVNPAFRYAQAWSMIHFFMNDHRPLLRRYIQRLSEGDTAEEAFDATFAKEDLPALQAAWHRSFQLPGSPPR